MAPVVTPSTVVRPHPPSVVLRRAAPRPRCRGCAAAPSAAAVGDPGGVQGDVDAQAGRGQPVQPGGEPLGVPAGDRRAQQRARPWRAAPAARSGRPGRRRRRRSSPALRSSGSTATAETCSTGVDAVRGSALMPRADVEAVHVRQVHVEHGEVDRAPAAIASASAAGLRLEDRVAVAAQPAGDARSAWRRCRRTPATGAAVLGHGSLLPRPCRRPARSSGSSTVKVLPSPGDARQLQVAAEQGGQPAGERQAEAGPRRPGTAARRGPGRTPRRPAAGRPRRCPMPVSRTATGRRPPSRRRRSS